MTSGQLTDQVTFYTPTATTDALRGQAVEYTTVLATVWCNWRSLTPREALVAQAMDVLPQYRVTIRFRTDIDVKLRAVHVRGREGACQVVGVNPIDDERFLEVDLVKVL